VMEELLTLDQVAYIRFASVYLDFSDINAFRDAIEKIEKTKATKKKR
jgi:transcriptional repressor NrdR